MSTSRDLAVAKAAERREPSTGEKRAIKRARDNHGKRPTRPEIKSGLNEAGAVHLETAHSDYDGGAYQMQDAFGSSSHQFVSDSLLDLVNIVGVDSDSVGSAVSLIAGVNPQNELESALAQQMAITHELMKTIACRVKGADQIDVLNAYGNLTTKLSRTFTGQVEALTKLRTGGKQVVEHRYIYVGEGGQAIVADEFHNHGALRKGVIGDQAHTTRAIGSGTSLLSSDEEGNGVPIARGRRKKAVPDARRGEGEWGAEGE